MKLLAVADTADPGLWDYFTKDKLEGVDAILSCGDLPSSYLRFLVTMGNIPVFYVHGNHDAAYEYDPPEGCVCIDGELVRFKGYNIFGLGGCFRYSGGPHQYTERAMRRRLVRVWGKVRRNGVDILVTHAPAQGLGDMDDVCHRGFACFRALLDRCRPLYHCYGHVHLQYAPTMPRTRQYGETTVVNVSGKYLIELPDRAEPPKKWWRRGKRELS